ncbi:hypothetical protein [Flavobacterium sp. 3-210]
MEKQRILLKDSKGFFLKAFKRNFIGEFDFFEESFFCKTEKEAQNEEFDCSIFVVYDKYELINCLKLDKKGTNVVVCFFNKRLSNSVSFLQEFKSLLIVECYKTKDEIVKVLKLHFKRKVDFMLQPASINFPTSNIVSLQNNNFCNAFFFID